MVVLLLFPAFWMFDRLVRIEYENHRKSWEADGKPHGFFWVPGEVKGFLFVQWSSSAAFRRCTLKWLVWNPNWVSRDENARRAIFWWRILVSLWVALWFVYVFLVLR
jgi:hypothetical protein